jgi:hypothetical protein
LVVLRHALPGLIASWVDDWTPEHVLVRLKHDVKQAGLSDEGYQKSSHSETCKGVEVDCEIREELN